MIIFIATFGRYFFKRFPFGIASAPEGLERVVCHIYDVLVWEHSQEEHNSWLHAVFRKLGSYSTWKNVRFQKVQFLGHIQIKESKLIQVKLQL